MSDFNMSDLFDGQVLFEADKYVIMVESDTKYPEEFYVTVLQHVGLSEKTYFAKAVNSDQIAEGMSLNYGKGSLESTGVSIPIPEPIWSLDFLSLNEAERWLSQLRASVFFNSTSRRWDYHIPGKKLLLPPKLEITYLYEQNKAKTTVITNETFRTPWSDFAKLHDCSRIFPPDTLKIIEEIEKSYPKRDNHKPVKGSFLIRLAVYLLSLKKKVDVPPTPLKEFLKKNGYDS